MTALFWAAAYALVVLLAIRIMRSAKKRNAAERERDRKDGRR